MERRWLAVLGMAVALQAGETAWARPASREAVRAVLHARDAPRMSDADWWRLGDDVDAHLVAAAVDPSLVFGARQRALNGLAEVRGERARELLGTFAGAADAPAPLLATAIRAYARGFGKEDAREVQRLGVGLLDHPDWLVRKGAVHALQQVGGEPSLAALRRHQAREAHPAVQQALRAALSEAEGPAR